MTEIPMERYPYRQRTTITLVDGTSEGDKLMRYFLDGDPFDYEGTRMLVVHVFSPRPGAPLTFDLVEIFEKERAKADDE